MSQTGRPERRDHAPIPVKFGWLPAIMIVIAALVCYIPALRSGFIWDDNDYLTNNPHLASVAGLGRIWFKLGATPQYYPMVFTSFWLEKQLWGLHPFGYHLVNVLLHAGSAVLLALILGRLGVRGTWLAGLIFALHPVAVESVAWVTERKNVLSSVFYLFSLAALLRVYRLDDSPSTPAHDNFSNYPAARFDLRLYLLALALFTCALLSKTVTCSLPVAILIILWWKRGRVHMSELAPLVPFFILGAALGLVTAWMEKHNVGAQGVDWSLSPVDRCLVAGRVIWFYLGKLLWPAGQTFIYPRWQVDSGSWWQYLFPLGAAALLLVLWLARRTFGRGPLAAYLFFGVTLFPALGFIDVYPMRFSFVADHFQYLAMLGPIALAGAVVAKVLDRLPPERRLPGRICACVLLAAVLGPLTWRQGHNYKDLETLWRSNLARNPKSWLAMNNLGSLLENQGQKEQAFDCYQRALQENPRWADAHTNLANLLQEQGRIEEAQAHYAEAYRLKPAEPMIPFNLGLLFVRQNRWEDADGAFRKALSLLPDFADAHYNLATVLMVLGKTEEAIEHYERALQLVGDGTPQHLDALAAAYSQAGRFDDAVRTAQKALEKAGGLDNGLLAAAISERLKLYRSHRPYTGNQQ